MKTSNDIWGAEGDEQESRELRAAADLLAFGAEPVRPPPDLRARVVNRVQAGETKIGATQSASVSGAPFVIAAEPGNFTGGRGWKTILPGVHVRSGSRERALGYKSTLMRMEPGSTYPAHAHEVLEEVCVLEGDCYFDEFTLGPGDYYQAHPGSNHGSLGTRNGCLMIIMEISPTAERNRQPDEK